MIPFSAEVYFAVLAAYNEAVWPLQALALALAGLALVVALRAGAGSGWLPALVLAAAWAWTAVAYFYLQFAQIDFWSYGVAAVFMVQALLLAWVATARRFAFASGPARWTMATIAGLGLAGYPLLGLFLRGAPAEAGWFGTSPAPTVLVTLGLLAGLRGGAPLYLMVAPAAWCAWQSVYAYQLAIVEDFMLAPAVIAAVAACLRSRHVDVD